MEAHVQQMVRWAIAGFVTSIFILLYALDTYIRVCIQKTRYCQWFKQAFYVRVLIFIIALLASIWLNLFIMYTQHELLFSILNCGAMTLVTSFDFFLTAFCTKTHVQFMPSHRRYFGFIVASIGTVLSVCNWAAFIVLPMYTYTLFWIVMLSVYLAVSVVLEINHFVAVYYNAFINESAVNTGINGFRDTVSRPTFRFTHCCVRYLVVAVWFVFGYRYNYDTFFLCVYPATICIWNISSFLQRTANRPKPKGCCLSIWNSYLGCLYNAAVQRHARMNAQFQSRSIERNTNNDATL